MSKIRKEIKKLQYIILVGVSGMGKTYWTTKNTNIQDDVVISLDKIIIDKYPNLSYHEALQKVNHKEIKDELIEELESSIENGEKNIIIDGTNLKEKIRKQYLSFIKDSDVYEKMAIVFPIPENKEIEKMVEFRSINDGKFVSEMSIKEQIKKYQVPQKDEGFDKIIRLK